MAKTRSSEFVLLLAICLAVLSFPSAAAIAGDSTGDFVGRWSCASLSRPGVPILIALHTDGTATERVGEYRGRGTWKPGEHSASISWESGWTGLLRRTAGGAYELLTWKPETPRHGPPDDAQPATRVLDP